MMPPVPELIFRPLRSLASVPEAVRECVLFTLLEENAHPDTPWYFSIVDGQIGISAEAYRLDGLVERARVYLDDVLRRCSQR